MHIQTRSTSFDFEQWSDLANNDPEGFEAHRSAVIEAAIERAPARTQARLRRLQWKLDQIRHTAPSPLAASLRMNQLLWDSLAGPDGLLDRLQQPPGTTRRRSVARVIPFPAGLSQPKD